MSMDGNLTSPLMKCPYCGVLVNAADPYNQHICPGPPKSQGFGAQQEMVSLQAIRAALGRIEQSVSEVDQSLAESYKGPEILDTLLKVHAGLGRIEESQDKLLQSHAALSGQMSAGFDGLADAIIQAQDAITECNARNCVQLQKNLTAKPKRPAKPRSRKP